MSNGDSGKLIELMTQAGNCLKQSLVILEAKNLPTTFAEKTQRLRNKLGLKKMAWKLDVDKSTINGWCKGGVALKKNQMKVDLLYREIFG